MKFTRVRRFARRLHQCAFSLLALFAAVSLMAPVRADLPTEYELKAAFLFNFAKFTVWPPEAFADAATPIIIGIVGDAPVDGILAELVKNETIHGHSLALKHFAPGDDLKHCHILFISKSEKSRAAELLGKLGDASVLTVGETDGFAQRGGIINFFIKADKLRFEINVDAVKQHRLRLNSQLMQLGTSRGS